MKTCKNCQIKFVTTEELCPLCQNGLSGKSSSVFPSNVRYKTGSFLLKLLLFLSIMVVLLVGFIEFLVRKQFYYTWFVGGGLFTNYIIIYFTLKKRQNVLGLFLQYGFIFVVLSFLWYLGTGYHVIPNFIIPSICIFELLFNSITFIVLKNNYIVNYFSFVLLNLLLLLFPVLLLLFHVITFPILSYICFFLSLVILVGLLIFYFDEIIEELKKRLNL